MEPSRLRLGDIISDMGSNLSDVEGAIYARIEAGTDRKRADELELVHSYETTMDVTLIHAFSRQAYGYPAENRFYLTKADDHFVLHDTRGPALPILGDQVLPIKKEK